MMPQSNDFDPTVACTTNCLNFNHIKQWSVPFTVIRFHLMPRYSASLSRSLLHRFRLAAAASVPTLSEKQIFALISAAPRLRESRKYRNAVLLSQFNERYVSKDNKTQQIREKNTPDSVCRWTRGCQMPTASQLTMWTVNNAVGFEQNRRGVETSDIQGPTTRTLRSPLPAHGACWLETNESMRQKCAKTFRNEISAFASNSLSASFGEISPFRSFLLRREEESFWKAEHSGFFSFALHSLPFRIAGTPSARAASRQTRLLIVAIFSIKLHPSRLQWI